VSEVRILPGPLYRSVLTLAVLYFCGDFSLSQGVHPKLAQELLGHSDIATTLDAYSHVIPSTVDRTARRWRIC
jgi:integrase